MTKTQIHALLAEVFEKLASLHGHLDDVRADTAFNIGLAAGQVSKAKALIGREIDDSNGVRT